MKGGLVMKNRRFLAISLILAMMLVGVGYAAWQADITAGADVSTASLEYEVFCTETSADVVEHTSPMSASLALDAPVPPSIYSNGIIATLTDAFPEAYVIFTVEVRNHSVLPLYYVQPVPVDIVYDPEGDALVIGTMTVEVITDGTIEGSDYDTLHIRIDMVDTDNASQGLDNVNVDLPIVYSQTAP